MRALGRRLCRLVYDLARRRGPSRPGSPCAHPTAGCPDPDTDGARVRRQSSARRHRAWLRRRDLALALARRPIRGCGPDRVVRFVRGIIHSGHPKDAVPRFSQAERRVIFTRAGNRCEHHFPIFGRCRTTTGLEADHVHPHSRGGWTSVSNGQALCRRHNREKSARVPWNRQLNNLAKRRSHLLRRRPRPSRRSPPTSIRPQRVRRSGHRAQNNWRPRR